jgi:hypothetical protein
MTLGRQLLLGRVEMAPLEAMRHLGGLNAQHRRSPYISLWSRLGGFQRRDLEEALARGEAYKATLMRGTLHLVAADEYPHYFAALAEARRRAFRGFFPRVAKEINEVLVHDKLAEALRQGEAVAFREFERILQPLYPEAPAASLSFAAKALAPVVQLPPAGAWRGNASPQYGWVAVSLETDPRAAEEDLLLRYLAAFGPATAQDFAQWSGLGAAQAQAVQGRLGDRLRRLECNGELLLDLARPPEIPGADPPVRFLPRWDNLLLAYRDRSRVLAPDLQDQVIMRDGRVLATFLVDGQVAGLWDVEETASNCTVVLRPLRPLTRRRTEEVVGEADHLAEWLVPGGRGGHRLER